MVEFNDFTITKMKIELDQDLTIKNREKLEFKHQNWWMNHNNL
jgi:hypothetical protein